ncbi:hypothetical protein RCL_jg22191.t2 [Rhizophagus clarus]|uniref:Uncharacterized protein n=1 Tax=Rhizophagus clarus TaxID=94130 RepID=A0A8H3QPH0_9GLOM|nr:hypothetical protein RCL_jg22191.t2 [Rhizophagus clarus]
MECTALILCAFGKMSNKKSRIDALDKNLSPSKNNQQSVDSKKAKTNAKDDDDEDKDNTVNGFNRRCTEVEDHPI